MAAVDRTTILIVEDDRELRDLYRASLSAAGYIPIALADGLSALRYFEQDSIPHAIVLDIGLPRVSGRDVHREIAANPATSHIPIVIVTGAEVGAIGLRKFDCVLKKPVSIDALLEAVRNCVERQSSDKRGPQPSR
jgi:two-component system, OmpR family, response regulator VicR